MTNHHRHTPTLTAIDSRNLPIRQVANTVFKRV